MGNYIYPKKISNNLTNQFVDWYILDKEYNIIVGIYKNSNTMINQGICIGYNNNVINKIKLGIFHRHNGTTVELFFENNIKLILTKDISSDKVKLTLACNNLKIDKYIDIKIIKNIKLINNNSEYIDLIFKII